MWRSFGRPLKTGPGPGVDGGLLPLAGAAGAWIPLLPGTAGLALAAAAVAVVLLVLAARLLSRTLGRATSEGFRADALDTRTLELEQRVSTQAARLIELEQRLAERDRALKEAKDEAERVVKSKSDLLARVSHELRTSLNAMLGFAQLLAIENLPAAQRAHVDRILATGGHLLELVLRAADLDQIEAGHVSLSSEPVAVREIVRQVVDAVQPLAAERRVRLRADDTDPAPYVRADPERLRQVLLGLCSNAIAVNREGGLVTLACKARDGNRLRILVGNTGSGIPPQAMERLFAPVDRLAVEPPEGPGTGLTLAVSRRLVEAMGGAMGAESTPGEGGTLWVELPVAEPPGVRPQREETPHPPQPKDRYTVLYIEDNLSNLKLVEHVIQRRPRIHLISAFQGRRGLELAQGHRPDLILLDLHLPDIAGDELLHRLRQNPDTRHIPVVVVSADALPGQVRRLLDAGARAYLTKPIDIVKLLAVVDEILSGGPAGAADAPRAPSTVGSG